MHVNQSMFQNLKNQDKTHRLNYLVSFLLPFSFIIWISKTKHRMFMRFCDMNFILILTTLKKFT
jgi:hypothetical protein